LIQSQCYNKAFRSDQNLLICAPTGAGKTNIAMLAILREIEKHIGPNFEKPSVIDNLFKIIYISPMKALAGEIERKFSLRLSYLGIKVRELSGDMQLTKKEIEETHIILTTPEKWDVVTRKANAI
jgi:replicative superfamily II helicase